MFIKIVRNIIFFGFFLVFTLYSCNSSETKGKNSDEIALKGSEVVVVDIIKLISNVKFRDELYELKKPKFDIINVRKDSLIILRNQFIKQKDKVSVMSINSQLETLAYNLNKLEEEFNDQVRQKLNEYIEDFGKEHEYEVIIGGTGNGNVLYTKDTNDITDELIEYINEKF